MFIEIVPNRTSPPAVLLRESWREGGKVRKRTLAALHLTPARSMTVVLITLQEADARIKPRPMVSVNRARAPGSP